MSNRRLILAWGPAVVWMGLIFLLSSQSTLPTFPSIVPDRIAKKGAHFVEYAILAVLCWRALRQTIRAGNPATWAFALTVLYAASDEWHQTFVRGRHGRLTDILIDSSGALVGLAAAHWWAHKKSGAGGARRPAPGMGTGPAGVRDPEIADGT